MKIAVLGPCRPSEFIGDIESSRAGLPEGLGGTPINDLVRGLLDLGHHVHLISASPDVTSVWRGEGPQFSISVVPFRNRAKERALDLFRKERNLMARELASSDAEVVSAHWSYEFGWVGVTSRKPCVLSVHDAPLTILRNLPDAYRLIRTLMAYRVRLSASCVTAVSPYLAKTWRRQMLFPKAIRVIPNMTPPLPIADPQPRRMPVILDIADGSSLKNVRRLIEAFGIFNRDVHGYELRLVGPGLGEDDEMARWAAARNLSEGVRFFGKQSRSQIARHLAEASLFCHPSLEESQPMCLLEAMAAGVPIIGGYRAGGVPWTLDGGKAGLLVDVSRPEVIASALRDLHENTPLADRLVEHGRRLVTDRHSKQNVTTAYLEELRRASLFD
ncbi:glycosyltransferase [Pseudarthrobacter sulfonivorans]|uniref:glycosyltransferase n=1 Tax=Pseudarthrobacter sulfonivorans TaxID=121292 RepID=UPI0009F903C9